jgi:hypothetical protein
MAKNLFLCAVTNAILGAVAVDVLLFLGANNTVNGVTNNSFAWLVNIDGTATVTPNYVSGAAFGVVVGLLMTIASHFILRDKEV